MGWRRASGLVEWQRKRRAASVGVEKSWRSRRVPEEEEGS